MRILLIQPGYSFPRHFNYHEAVLRLLQDMYSAEIDVLACDSAVRACGFRSGPGLKFDSPFHLNGGRLGCWKCQRKLKKRTSEICERYVSVKDHLVKGDYKEAELIVGSLPEVARVEDILELSVCGVNIGKDIWQSIQRYLFSGAPESLPITKNSVTYEFIKTGVLYAISIRHIFEKNKYDYILTNERAYVEWGIPNRVALSMGIKVIHVGADYFSNNRYKGLNLAVLRRAEEISDLFHAPKKDAIEKVFNSDDLIRKYSKQGEGHLGLWMGESNYVRNNNEVSEWFCPDRKTVVVFTHLCWDASSTFGEMVYNSFESWLKATYKIAMDNKSVDWVFRIHPAEANAHISTENNTYKLLEQLNAKNPSEHIKIMGGGVKLKTIDFIPHMHAGVTALGTVSFELPALGVPCIVASRGSYAKFDFSISGSDRLEYEEIIANIASIQRPSERQQEMAKVYAGLTFSGDNIIKVGEIFDKEDANDLFIDKDRLNNWLSSKDARQKMQKMLENKTADLIKNE